MCLYFCRHGQTSEDTEDNDRVSGWNEVGLNAEGRLNAARCGRELKRLGITSITSSDTRRALETAKIASKIVGIPIVESDKLRSWNMGNLQGMLHKTANPFLAFFEKNPDVKVPGGEKFRTFYNRFRGVFDSLVSYSRKFPDAKPAIFTHSQDLDLIQWIIRDIEPGKELEFGDGIKPGGILEVRTENNEIRVRKLRF